MEGERSNQEEPGLKFEEVQGEKLRGHEAGEGLKLMHEGPKLAELEQGLAGHEWPEVSGLVGDAGGERAPLSPS